MASKYIMTAALVSLMVVPAYAQAPGSSSPSSNVGIPLSNEAPLSPEEMERQKALDREYNATMQKIPDKKPSADPWGDIRTSTPTTTKRAKNNNN